MSATPRPTLASRLILRYAITVVAILAILAFALDRVLAAEFLDSLTRSLVSEATAVRRALPADEPSLQQEARSLGDELGVRITVIRTDGVVLADSTRDPSALENHADRPEVRAALDGEVGVSSRTSETTGEPYRYVALPQEEGRIVRVALPLSIVQAQLSRVRTLVVGGAALAAVLGVAAVWLVARGLTRPLRRMTDTVARMSEGELDARVRPDGTRELALLAGTLNGLASELGARIDQVHRERQGLDGILSAMDEGVLLVDEDETIRYTNPSARRMLAATAGPAHIRELAPSALRLLLDKTRMTARAAEAEIETGIPSRLIRATALPIEPRGQVLLVLRDVTEARRVEAMRHDFVADASHELKTPVASIRATAETVRTAIEDDPRAAVQFSERLHRESVRLAQIVSDLLDLSRLETERPRFEPVRLDRIVTEEVARLSDDARKAGVNVAVAVQPTTVGGSPKDLALLVRNLLDNAIRYSDRGGSVRVETESADGAVVSVTDSGAGIPSRDLPRIFERFYRVDRARSRETGGTGLGLSIARHVAEQHGGVIEADSELGRGSVFRVRFPRRS